MRRTFTIDQEWSQRGCCPACESNISKPAFQKEGVRFIECRNCHTVYVNPQPPSALLASIYEEYGDDYFTNPTKLSVDFRPDRYRREIRLIDPTMPRDRLLDVGCATGSFLKLATLLGFERVCGIDIAAASVTYANETLGSNTAIVGDFLARPFAECEFDAVTLWATLEHVLNPQAFICEAQRVLKPGGMLYISVPNRLSINFILLRAKWHLVSIEHLNYFTPGSLEGLIRSCGFTISKIATYGFNPLLFITDLLQRRAEEHHDIDTKIRESARNANLRHNRIISAIESRVNTIVNILRVGEAVMIAAQKPLAQ